MQWQILHRLPKFLIILSEMLPAIGLCKMFVDLMNSIKDCEKIAHIPEKLNCMLELVKSPLFAQKGMLSFLLSFPF